MGYQWILDTPELEDAFRRDWEAGIPLKIMAAMYGYKQGNSVSRAAQRLGLAKRSGGRPAEEWPRRLEGGTWVVCTRRRVLVWRPDENDATKKGRR